MERSVKMFTKAVENNKAKLREVVKLAKESVDLKFTRADVAQVYETLDNPTVCKYLALIQKAEGQALKDAEAASKTLTNASLFLDKTFADTEKMWTRGMDDVNGALSKLQKLLDS